MGYVPPDYKPAPRLNLDRWGLPRDYKTYVWLLYRRDVPDESPARLAFEHGTEDAPADFGQQLAMR